MHNRSRCLLRDDQSVQAEKKESTVSKPEKDWDEEALLPMILNRYHQSLPSEKETANQVVRLMGYISVTQQGKSLIRDMGNTLFYKALTTQVDNRLENPGEALTVNREYIVGLPQTVNQQRISPENLS
jgi:hypothetical protein